MKGKYNRKNNTMSIDVTLPPNNTLLKYLLGLVALYIIIVLLNYLDYINLGDLFLFPKWRKEDKNPFRFFIKDDKNKVPPSSSR
tara:strand:- start:496 stop:747 length:252 start_codon:yes stop_codon:yes gene_type:complete